MKKRTKVLLISALIFLVIAAAAYFIMLRIFDIAPPKAPQASVGLGLFYGPVQAAGGGLLPGPQPISGARVRLQPGDYETTTDRDGVYYLNDIPPGTYTLTFSAAGYEDQVVERVRALPGQPQLIEGALFDIPKGPAAARLSVTTAMGMGRPPAEHPYNATVYIDAGKSENASREGFRWEIFGPEGELVEDPFQPGQPLSLAPSQMPGSSPYVFTFIPPYAGEFTLRLYLSNNLYDAEDKAEVTVKAINVAPSSFPSVYPGPLPPTKEGRQGLSTTEGLRVAEIGSQVYLRGFAVDRNYPSPELYNPGGREPNIYGQNDDHYQGAFSWQWELYLLQDDGERVNLTDLLQNLAGIQSSTEQHLTFTAKESGTYRAYLIVNDNDPYGALESEAAFVEIRILDEEAYISDARCLDCHNTSNRSKAPLPAPFEQTFHGQTGAAGCQDCHGPGAAHGEAANSSERRATIDTSYDAGSCGRCHSQYNQWEKSFHSDGYAFGHAEIAGPLLLNCAKCHYPQGFIEATSRAAKEKITFKEVEFKAPLFPGGPIFFDFSMTPEPDGKSISCVACHDPHARATAENPTALRGGGAQDLCGTCHQDKWQNVIMEGTAGSVSAYEYPGSSYNFSNPHNTDGKCVLCHMDTTNSALDERGNREVGGHTLRMRSLGTAEILGGYGPRFDNPSLFRGGEVAGNILNLAPCQECHGSAVTSFNYRGLQREIFALWNELGELLRERNNGYLPGYKPGDKCATCHRGGTLPFENDPGLILENAYSNYKLIGNDRSWGLHNPQYTRQLLVDSIAAVKQIDN